MNRKIIQGVTSSLTIVLIEEQIRFIEKNGYQVKVVCNEDFKKSYDDIKIRHIPFEREISIVKDMGSLYRLYRYLRAEKPDIINFSTPKAGLLGMVAGFLSGVDHRIYIQRGLRLETVTGLKYHLLYLTEKIACQLSTHVMVISDSLEAEMISRKLLSRHKVVRIGRGSSNGTDMEKFNPERIDTHQLSSLRNGLDIKPSDFVIGCVGRMTKDKGMNELVAAFTRLEKKYDHLKLLLVGDFENGDPITERNRKTIADHDDIIHCPFTDSIEYYYSLMDLFAFPTFREGFGNVSIEAQAMGVPVVTFDATGARDTVLDGRTGIIVKRMGAEGLTAALDDLIHDAEKRRRLADQARNFAAGHFDRRHMQEALLKFYNSLGEQGDAVAEKNDGYLGA
ncbi:glycosyltransferase family 4 protein [Salinicoccus albus]|uniref:glycosyltransferase family 4 protein n=1 Tax=Salinicoccus albus TaxID=418756 RepID=UPI0003637A8D|nr:glycosyltransferase family 4 protein [Salinicoccus albus]